MSYGQASAKDRTAKLQDLLWAVVRCTDRPRAPAAAGRGAFRHAVGTPPGAARPGLCLPRAYGVPMICL